jgi:lipid-binding SYLF domain-containing protein
MLCIPGAPPMRAFLSLCAAGGDTIPKELLWGCSGIAFLTMVKGGFFFSGTVGTGLVVARLPDGGWSAPSAIMLANIGWGFQVGGEVSDVMFVLNSQV